ncbi:hypothetical protein MCEKH45_01929 [Methylophilaceae bacterium]
MTSLFNCSKPMSDSDCENLIDKQIGKGGSRTVYSIKENNLAVVKKININYIGANATEWFIWNSIKNTKLKNKFGECFCVSESAQYLIMEFLKDISPDEFKQIKDSVPYWVGDNLKIGNFGKNLIGLVKVRDYAILNYEDFGKILAENTKKPSDVICLNDQF